MGTDVATIRNGSTAVASFGDDPWAAYAAQHGNSNAGVQYMKFDGNTGVFNYGADRTELEEGTQLAVNMNEYKTGFICWKDQEVVDEKMISVIEVFAGAPPIVEAHLKDHGPYKKYANGATDGWVEQQSVGLKLLDDGTDMVFKSSSVSGIRSLKKLLSDYAAGRKVHGADAVPIVEISTTTFVPKNAGPGAGKKYVPVFTIVAWKSPEELEALAAEEVDTEVEEEEAAPPPPPAPKAAEGARKRRF
jgi:hypothetical protein